MRQIHCFRCGSARIIDGRSQLFILLGVIMIVAGLTAAFMSFSSQSQISGDYGVLNKDATIAGIVICYGFMLINQGGKRNPRVTCKMCGSEFTPPKPRTAYKS
jgi:hypothetical protein